MKLSTPNIQLIDTPLTPYLEAMLLASSNAMAAFVTPVGDSLPPSTYLAVYRRSVFVGAVHLEDVPGSKEVLIHPMLLERDRELFTEVTEAAILWCLYNLRVPTTQVRNTPEYKYMHEFLISADMELCWHKRGDWIKYYLPPYWKPRSFHSFTPEFS